MTIKKKKRKAGSHAGEGAVIEEGVCGRFSNRQREKIYFTQQHLTKKNDEVSSDGSIYSRSAQLIDGSSHRNNVPLQNVVSGGGTLERATSDHRT